MTEIDGSMSEVDGSMTEVDGGMTEIGLAFESCYDDAMKLNDYYDTLATVQLDKHDYPIKIVGNGAPCFCIGIGSLMLKTLSDEFKSMFKLFSSDLYWVDGHGLEQPHTLSMDKIIEDIQSCAEQLQLDDYYILAHSAYGIVAIEAAKKITHLKGLILIGSPPMSNNTLATYAREYFKTQASAERQANDQQRREHYQSIARDGASELSFDAYERESARYWADFTISHEFLTELWRDCQIDEATIDYFFTSILPPHDINHNMSAVKVPVILAAGEYDYDCIPLIAWDKYATLPQDFTLLHCPDAGHWPNIESVATFDQGIKDWLTKMKS